MNTVLSLPAPEPETEFELCDRLKRENAKALRRLRKLRAEVIRSQTEIRELLARCSSPDFGGVR